MPSDDLNQIQAICAILQVCFTFASFAMAGITLFFLWKYTHETTEMRKTAQEQHAASMRPIVGLRVGEHPTDRTDKERRWFFVNAGPGVALNIRCIWGARLTFAHIEPNGYQNITVATKEFADTLNRDGFAVAYEDIFGNVFVSQFNPGISAFDDIGVRPKKIGINMAVDDIWRFIATTDEAKS